MTTHIIHPIFDGASAVEGVVLKITPDRNGLTISVKDKDGATVTSWAVDFHDGKLFSSWSHPGQKLAVIDVSKSKQNLPY